MFNYMQQSCFEKLIVVLQFKNHSSFIEITFPASQLTRVVIGPKESGLYYLVLFL